MAIISRRHFCGSASALLALPAFAAVQFVDLVVKAG
jgi:hypothetical protein